MTVPTPPPLLPSFIIPPPRSHASHTRRLFQAKSCFAEIFPCYAPPLSYYPGNLVNWKINDTPVPRLIVFPLRGRMIGSRRRRIGIFKKRRRICGFFVLADRCCSFCRLFSSNKILLYAFHLWRGKLIREMNLYANFFFLEKLANHFLGIFLEYFDTRILTD